MVGAALDLASVPLSGCEALAQDRCAHLCHQPKAGKGGVS